MTRQRSLVSRRRGMWAMSEPVPRRLPAVLMAVAGGLLTETAFPQRSWWPMAFVGVALLVLAMRRDSARWAALMGFLWGLSFFLPHLWWAREAVAAPPWVLLSVAEAGIVAAGCALWVWVRRGRWLRDRTVLLAVPFALVWVVTEQARQVFPFGGFPWGRLAFSQTDSPLLRVASIGGAPAVSAVTVAIGFLLATAVLRLAKVDMLRASVAVGAAAAALGGSALIPLPTAATDGTLRVGAVQGNVAEPGLGAFANAREVLENHIAGTETLAQHQTGEGYDLVVWPENSSDINPRADAEAAEGVDRAVEAIGAPLLFGTDRYDRDADPAERFNEMVLWMPGEGPVFAYAKQIPAPFAEYIPLRNLARMVTDAVDLVSVDMVPGEEIAVVPVPIERLDRTVRVATVICFEVAYDGLIRESVLGGAEVLFVPTNNASFGYTAESEQQFAMTRLRAVEHGRAAVQISTVGVSGVVAPDGAVLLTTDLFTAAQFSAELPLRTELTIADRVGDAPTVLAIAAVGLLLLVGIHTGRQRPRRQPGEAAGDTAAEPDPQMVREKASTGASERTSPEADGERS